LRQKQKEQDKASSIVLQQKEPDRTAHIPRSINGSRSQQTRRRFQSAAAAAAEGAFKL
jgi:hypothetical protein